MEKKEFSWWDFKITVENNRWYIKTLETNIFETAEEIQLGSKQLVMFYSIKKKLCKTKKTIKPTDVNWEEILSYLAAENPACKDILIETVINCKILMSRF
jgi:hypothetical protein